MSDFHSQFQSYFTAEERGSELYQILATIGVNVEKTIREEINARPSYPSEATVFTDQKLRSWLAAFLMPVRNLISARGSGRMVITSAGTCAIPTLPAGSIL